MQKPPVREDELERQAELRACDILDTPEEPSFDGLARLAAHIADTPIALVSLVDGRRQWFKAHHGLATRETPVEVSFCGHAIYDGVPMLVPDALEDQRFVDNPLVTGEPRVRFYFGVPLQSPNGYPLGTLCMIDHVPRELSPQQRELLEVIARQVADAIELRRKSAELAREQELAARQERLAMAGTLAAGVGHEINNPLTYVAGNIELALEEVRDIGGGSPSGRLSELATLLVDARDGADRIRKIVKGLLAFAREDSPIGPTDLTRCVEVATNLAMHELRQRVRVHTSLEGVPLVMADDSRLSQVLVNLLVNASHAFEVEDPERNLVTVRARNEDPERVVLEVSDNGQGIASDDLQRIFDPFFTTKPVGVGTGLGLSICQAIVRSFGGEISVSSQVGKGTTFTVALRAVTPVSEGPPADSLRALPRVLVVDDDVVAARTITRALARIANVTGETDPRQAIARLERGEDFALVLCDVSMPHLSGPDCFERAMAARPEMAGRFVFLTGGVVQPDLRKALRQTGRQVMTKPFDLAELRSAVLNLSSPPAAAEA